MLHFMRQQGEQVANGLFSEATARGNFHDQDRNQGSPKTGGDID